MERADIDGIALEYAVTGAGQPVICIHGAFIADAFQPLLTEPSLAGLYQLITYRRRGYGNSSRTSGPISIAQQAADCGALLAHLGVERVHVVGHSFGGAIALQLALDIPSVVHSLALIEPALMIGTSGGSYREALVRGAQRYREADPAVVVDEFLQARWPGYRERLDHLLPGAFAQAVADAGTWFETDLPALLTWHFDTTEARQITQPVLSVLGERVRCSGIVLAKSTDGCSNGFRTRRGWFCPAPRTSRSSSARAAWPRSLPPSSTATRFSPDPVP